MQFVHEALRNKHKDELVWIVGADPTVADLPKDFLDDKLSIVLGDAQKVFQNGTYNYNNEWKTVAEFGLDHPEYLARQHIWAYPFFAMSPRESREFVAAREVERVWHLNYRSYPPRDKRDDILGHMGYDAMVELVHKAIQGDAGPYGGFATCLHCALYSAILMGCDAILIVACSHRIIDGYFKPAELGGKRLSPGVIAKMENRWSRYAERGTRAIMEGCRKEGIGISRWDGGSL